MLFASNVITFFVEFNCTMHLMHNNPHTWRPRVKGMRKMCNDRNAFSENNDLHNENYLRSHRKVRNIWKTVRQTQRDSIAMRCSSAPYYFTWMHAEDFSFKLLCSLVIKVTFRPERGLLMHKVCQPTHGKTSHRIVYLSSPTSVSLLIVCTVFFRDIMFQN